MMPKGYAWKRNPAAHDDRLASVRGMASDGMTMREVAAELGLTYHALRKWCTGRVRFGKKSLTSPDALPCVMAAVCEGYDTPRKISPVVGRDKSLVSRWLREFERRGLVRRRGNGVHVRFVPTEKWPLSRRDPRQPMRMPPAGRGRASKRKQQCTT